MSRKTDTIYKKTVRQVQKEYNDSLERAVRKSRDFFKKVDDVNSGKIKVPSSLKTEKQIDSWKRGYLQRAAKTEKVVENILDEMRLAGLKTRKKVQQMTVKLYGEESKSVISILDKKGRYNITAPTSTQISDLLRKGSTSFEKVSLKHLGQSGNATQKLRHALAISISKGESSSKAIRRIQDITNIKENDAKRILRTEKTRVCGQAQQETCQEFFDKTGIKPKKRWICTFHNSRDAHIAVHNEVVDFDEAFSNGLLYPGDPNASAAEVVNCQCEMEIIR